MEKDYTFPPCNLCEKLFTYIRSDLDNLPPDEARAKAVEKFREIRKDAVCLNFYTCMPVTRNGYQDIHS